MKIQHQVAGRNTHDVVFCCFLSGDGPLSDPLLGGLLPLRPTMALLANCVCSLTIQYYACNIEQRCTNCLVSAEPYRTGDSPPLLNRVLQLSSGPKAEEQKLDIRKDSEKYRRQMSSRPCTMRRFLIECAISDICYVHFLLLRRIRFSVHCRDIVSKGTTLDLSSGESITDS